MYRLNSVSFRHVRNRNNRFAGSRLFTVNDLPPVKCNLYHPYFRWCRKACRYLREILTYRDQRSRCVNVFIYYFFFFPFLVPEDKLNNCTIYLGNLLSSSFECWSFQVAVPSFHGNLSPSTHWESSRSRSLTLNLCLEHNLKRRKIENISCEASKKQAIEQDLTIRQIRAFATYIALK